MDKLERDFKANGGEFREFFLSELFEIVGTKSLDEGKLEFFSEGINFIGRVNEFNGIKGKISMQNFQPNEANTITATVIGNYKYVKFQQEPYYCSQNINKLIPKFEINRKIAIYFITLISKFISQYNGQQSGYKLDDIKNFKIPLPCDVLGNIAFHYMESYIRELEALRLSEIEAYLAATGLKDYELNQKDKEALVKFDTLTNGGGYDGVGEFKIGELFSIKSNPQLNKDSFKFRTDSKYPYFTRTVLNNGIAGYVDYLDEEHKICGNSLAIGMLGMQFFYMEKDFYAGQFTKTAFAKFDNFNKKLALYFATILNKQQKNYQSVLVRDFEDKFKNTKITLPTKNSKPDFDFMQNFITAVQKIVIKDVVQWSKARVEATKMAIDKSQ